MAIMKEKAITGKIPPLSLRLNIFIILKIALLSAPKIKLNNTLPTRISNKTSIPAKHKIDIIRATQKL